MEPLPYDYPGPVVARDVGSQQLATTCEVLNLIRGVAGTAANLVAKPHTTQELAPVEHAPLPVVLRVTLRYTTIHNKSDSEVIVLILRRSSWSPAAY
jgi:hypothetical protein